MAHYRHLRHHGRNWTAATRFQRYGGSVPVNPSTGFPVAAPQTPLQYLRIMAANYFSDASTLEHRLPRMIYDDVLVIDDDHHQHISGLPPSFANYRYEDLFNVPSDDQRYGGAVPVDPYPNIGRFSYYSDHRMIDDDVLVIDDDSTTHHDQQMIDLNLLHSHNRGGSPVLSEEAISKHLKTRAATPEDTNEICTVCQDDLHDQGKNESIATLDCGHGYHADCIKRWLRLKNVCPLCNAVAIVLVL